MMSFQRPVLFHSFELVHFLHEASWLFIQMLHVHLSIDHWMYLSLRGMHPRITNTNIYFPISHPKFLHIDCTFQKHGENI